jgi:putative membrane protein
VDSTGAYCGVASVPDDWLLRWNLDPTLIGVALALFALHALVAHRGSRLPFAAGLGLALFAWISPLCALGVALFSARAAQHALLALAAAPLLARGLPYRASGSPRAAAVAAAAFAAVTWFWHAPEPYDWTFRSTGAYWAMHSSLLATAVAVWRALLDRSNFVLPSALGLATCLQMSGLGLLLVLARSPLFESHLQTTAAWGISPLEDQQLGGLLLWLPGCAAFLAAALVPLAAWLKGREPALPRSAL